MLTTTTIIITIIIIIIIINPFRATGHISLHPDLSFAIFHTSAQDKFALLGGLPLFLFPFTVMACIYFMIHGFPFIIFNILYNLLSLVTD